MKGTSWWSLIAISIWGYQQTIGKGVGLATLLPLLAMQQSVSNEKLWGSTILSFSMLGLSFDVYPALINCQLTASSFERTNEKLLLHLLHFLLSKLDLSFTASVASCWPYFEIKEKNEYKRIVSSYILKISSSNTNLSNADFRTSLLSVAKGSAVWILLGRLCDTALELSIRSLIVTNQIEATVTMTMHQSAGLWNTLTSTNTNEIMTAIQHEYNCIAREGNFRMARQDEQIIFSSDLDSRLQIATKNINKAKLEMARISQSEEVKYLSESSQMERSELIMRIKEMYAALKQLSKSSTFADSDIVEAFYSDQQYPRSLPLRPTSSSDKEMKSWDTESPIGIHGKIGAKNLHITDDEKGVKKAEIAIHSIPYKNVWHLDASSLEPLTHFLDSYTATKLSKTENERNGKFIIMLLLLRNIFSVVLLCVYLNDCQILLDITFT